jgi:hypothetical protein
MRIISSRTHTIIGLVVGVVLIAAPWIFGFADETAPMRTAIVVGAFIVLNELMTTSPASPAKLVPMRVHLGIDVLTGLVLAASPWIFGFSDLESNAWVPHLVVGLMVAGYALLTDPSDANRARGDGARTGPLDAR